MMKTLRRAWNRLVGCLGGHRQDAELTEEFEYRDQRGLHWLGSTQRDICYAFRGMRRSPGFTAVVVACLALGIGANTAIFSLINTVMIRSLPVSQPEQLVLLHYKSRGDIGTVRRTQVGDDQTSFPYAVYEALRERTQALSGVIAFVPLGLNKQSVVVHAGGQATVAGGEMVSGNYFSVLGVSPILGRAIVDDDVKSGAPNVAVISHQFWLREFGGEQSAIGRSMTVNGLPFTVVGVTPREFFGVNPAMPPDLWISLRDLPGLKPWGRLRPGPRGRSPFADRGYWWCLVLGRLKPGITKQSALAELDVLFRESITEGLTELPPAERLPHLAFLPARRGLENLRRSLSEPLRILMAAASLVLLIACVNVATLLLARARARRKEIGVRVAMGASRPRLVRQFLTESVVLSLCGGAAGLLLAGCGKRALLLLMAAAGQTIPLDVHLDVTVLAFSATVSMLTGAVFGLAPAFRATRMDLVPQLKDNAGGSAGRFTLSRILVAGQAALSVLLLFGAGLFLRTLLNLEKQDLGFNRHNLLLFEIDPRRGGATVDRTVAIYDRSLETIQALPGVRAASVSATALLSGYTDGGPVSTDGPAAPSERTNDVYFNIVGPDFLETMGIPILAGRGIGWRDVRARHRVAVVNRAMARSLFPNENPIGRRFSFEQHYDSDKAYEIVGVVQNAKYDSMRSEPPPTAYLPYGALPERIARMCFEVRTAGDPLSIVASVRETMRSIDPQLPLIDIRTQSDQINKAIGHERMFAGLTSLFGLLALLLVSVGVYGTLAYAVTRRTGEIGIRMALGASRLRVLWMVLRESLLLAGCGLAVGLPAALALARLVASRLFGVAADDTLTIAVTGIVLSAAAAAAGFLPANRASRIDPLRALRNE